MMQKPKNDWILFAHPEQCFVYHHKCFGGAVIFAGISSSESNQNNAKSLVTELEAPDELSAIKIHNKIQDILDTLKTHPRCVKIRVHWQIQNSEIHIVVKEIESWPLQFSLAISFKK